MSPIWTAETVIANLNNVPPQGTPAAQFNARLAFGMLPDFVAFAEAWHNETVSGIRAEMPSRYRLYGPQGNSARLAVDVGEWQLLLEGDPVLLHGAVASRVFGVVSDKRYLVWGVWRHRESGRLVCAAALHIAPPATKRSRAARLAAGAARATAVRRVRRWARRRKVPVIVLGDWNMTGRILGDSAAVRTSNADSIDHVETVSNDATDLVPLRARLRTSRYMDHPDGLVFIRVTARRPQ